MTPEQAQALPHRMTNRTGLTLAYRAEARCPLCGGLCTAGHEAGTPGCSWCSHAATCPTCGGQA